MPYLTIDVIFNRLLLSLVFSGLIGLEREKNNSNAGIKTHVLVGLGSTIIALIQVETISFVSTLSPDLRVSVDAVRLIAQVVSGIGFLGAGTIVITKRSITGLTTAASIWGVAALGLAFGMGYYEVALISSALIVIVLVAFKRFIVINTPKNILVKYIGGEENSTKVMEAFKKFDPEYETLKISTDIYKDTFIVSHVFRIYTKKDVKFQNISNELAKLNFVITVEHTDLW